MKVKDLIVELLEYKTDSEVFIETDKLVVEEYNDYHEPIEYKIEFK